MHSESGAHANLTHSLSGHLLLQRGPPARGDAAMGSGPAGQASSAVRSMPMSERASAAPLRAIVIEDSVPLGALYQEYLRQLDFKVEWYANGNEGLQAIAADAPDLLLLDLQLPDIHGNEILEQLQAAQQAFPRVVITANGSVEAAVEALRLGAVDFLEKPFSAERLKVTVDNVLDRVRLHEQVRVIRQQIERDGYAGFVGRSLPMQVVYRIIDSAASSRASVFITGESGTGKELCAQAIHERSDRSGKAFVAINCGAIPRELFESEIFGHIKGAFSGATADRMGAAERADGGTLFLDEIGEMDLDLQVKLLRFIQSGTFQRVGGNKTQQVDVRFVCATNRDPLALVGEGRFREDLYYRLNVIPIRMPALRERENDVIQIARHFLATLSAQEGRDFSGFAPDVEQVLQAYEWPGNVRQLHNVVHNAVLLNNGQLITRAMLPEPLSTLPGDRVAPVRPPVTTSATPPQGASGEGIVPLAQVEKRAIEQAIAHYDGNIPVAAAHLGVSASTIYRKIKAWDQAGA